MRLIIYETGETTFQFFETCIIMHGICALWWCSYLYMLMSSEEFTFTQRDDLVHMLIKRTKKTLFAVRWNITKMFLAVKEIYQNPVNWSAFYIRLYMLKNN